jgi:hypothetical protein
MRTLTNHEKRAVRVAAAAVAIYVAFICWKYFDAKRSAYQQVVKDVHSFRLELKPYGEKIIAVKKLMEEFHLDPAKLSKASAVAEASSAIQKAAAAGGVQGGPIRESPGRSSSKELASIKLEGSGQLPAVTSFLHRLESVGSPLIIDSVQITPDNMRPGMIKLSLTIIILDFEQWKNGEIPNA